MSENFTLNGSFNLGTNQAIEFKNKMPWHGHCLTVFGFRIRISRMAIERTIQMRSKVLGLAAGAFVMTASLAYAGTTAPQTASWSQNTNWGVPTLVELNFAGFDTSLGTLTSVT